MSRAVGSFVIAGFALACCTSGVLAQDAPPIRVRGTIERVDGDKYVVKVRDGTVYTVVLTDKPMLVANVKSSLADIKPNSFVGISGMPQPDGSQKAVEVHIFPEAMRGTGEGHYGWDLQPNSTMTNGNIEQSVVANDGKNLTVKYKDGEKRIAVSPDTPIVTYMPGEKSELVPGVKIFIPAAKKMSDGTLQTPRVNFGRGGIAPPM